MASFLFLENYFLSETFSDVCFVIKTDVQTFKMPAHKVILAAGSSELKRRFDENNDLNTIEIMATTAVAFKEFLFTFYSQCPEQLFSTTNAYGVLNLAKTFGVDRCTKQLEQFLIKNCAIAHIVGMYSISLQFQLVDLKQHIQKKINESKSSVFLSPTILNCSEDVLYSILTNLSVSNSKEMKVIWESCMNWARNQCTQLNMETNNLETLRTALGKCYDIIHSFALEDDDFRAFAVTHYTELFKDQSSQEESMLYTTAVNFPDENQNETEVFECARITSMLSTCFCNASEPMVMDIQATERVVLKGIAFSNMTTTPKGKIVIYSTDDVPLIDCEIAMMHHEQVRNFAPIDTVILEPNQLYRIKVVLSHKAIMYRPFMTSDFHRSNGFSASFKRIAGRDIFSHFFFSPCF